MASRRDTKFVLKNINKPILIFVGEEDKITPIENAEEMKRIAKNASLKTIKLAGHLSNRDNVKAFNKKLVNWTIKQF